MGVRFNGKRTGFKGNRQIFAVLRFVRAVFDRIEMQR